MTELVGMSNPRGGSGDCQWCGKPTSRVITVRETRYKPNGEIAELPITARACDRHAALADRNAEDRNPTPDELRRKHARNVPQLGPFEKPDATRSAIHG